LEPVEARSHLARIAQLLIDVESTRN
jgi:hypothetical protein